MLTFRQITVLHIGTVCPENQGEHQKQTSEERRDEMKYFKTEPSFRCPSMCVHCL